MLASGLKVRCHAMPQHKACLQKVFVFTFIIHLCSPYEHTHSQGRGSNRELNTFFSLALHIFQFKDRQSLLALQPQYMFMKSQLPLFVTKSICPTQVYGTKSQHRQNLPRTKISVLSFWGVRSCCCCCCWEVWALLLIDSKMKAEF